jgi:small subunit ribosomal protein S15
MTLLQERKQELISEYQIHETDTGSVDLQIAMLTERINRPQCPPCRKTKKTTPPAVGLLKMIGQRKRLMAYLLKQDTERYRNLIKKLGIRG